MRRLQELGPCMQVEDTGIVPFIVVPEPHRKGLLVAIKRHVQLDSPLASGQVAGGWQLV